MYILLPPSEAKAPGGRGRPLAARTMTASGIGGELAAARAEMLAALGDLCGRDPAQIAAALRLPAASAGQAIAANRTVADSPTMPALRRYQGVVYRGLDLAALPTAAQRLAGRRVLVLSGLFGVVRGSEPIPDYRVPASARLPGVGAAGRFWRARLATLLPQLLGSGLIVDLRSTDYAAMWRQPRSARVVTVRVLSPLPDGSYRVVSYPSKFAKGRLAAALLRQAADGAPATTAHEVAAAWQEGPSRVLDSGQVEIRTT